MADSLRDYMRHNPFLSKMDPDLVDEITARLTAWVTNMRDTMNQQADRADKHAGHDPPAVQRGLRHQ